MQQLPKQPSTVTKSSRNQAAPDSPKCIGIGTLGEKSLHQYLKNYLEPDPSLHEVPIGRYVGDIVNSQGVIEIQTGGFHPLKKKLAYYLSDPSLAGKTVTVACPLPAIKWLIWIDPDSGLTTQRRRSPKRTQPWEICRQLIYLLELLHHPALRFRLLMMEWEEFRCQNGWGRDGKRGSQRYERIPLRILEELSIDCAHPESFRILLPPGLPELFTVKDIMKAGKASRRLAQQMIQVLKAVRLVELKGKEGRCHLYACIRPSESRKDRASLRIRQDILRRQRAARLLGSEGQRRYRLSGKRTQYSAQHRPACTKSHFPRTIRPAFYFTAIQKRCILSANGTAAVRCPWPALPPAPPLPGECCRFLYREYF